MASRPDSLREENKPGLMGFTTSIQSDYQVSRRDEIHGYGSLEVIYGRCIACRDVYEYRRDNNISLVCQHYHNGIRGAICCVCSESYG
jgi:hypothetical protein